jgi:3-oxoacyl-(acyl-carrier-protein) synthase
VIAIAPNRKEKGRRVVVTGLGVIAPGGNSIDQFWGKISTGTSAAAPVRKFDVSRLPVRYSAEVTDFHLSDFVESRETRLDMTIQFSLAAAAQAMRDAKLHSAPLNPARIGIVEGTTISGSESVLKSQRTFLTTGDYRRLHPYNIVAGYCGEGSSTISQHLNIQGAAITYCSGCSSGNDAIGHAMQLIRDDEFDVMLAGGAEEMQEMLFVGFCKLRSMSEWDGVPSRAMRPFDAHRDGFLLGEGSAFLVLEELCHALDRGAPIFAEVIGHGRTSEAYHPTAPHPEGVGYRAAMTNALADAGILPEEVEHINAHGSATKQNDPIETKAIKAVFGEQARRISVSATKPLTGHLMGASGAIEALITVLTIQRRLIPPTVNLAEPDEGCDLDYVPVPRPYPVRTALCVNAGFGGRYSCLAFREFSGTR